MAQINQCAERRSFRRLCHGGVGGCELVKESCTRIMRNIELTKSFQWRERRWFFSLCLKKFRKRKSNISFQDF